MCYPDFPFKDSLPTFPHHTDVLDYIKQYTDHYDLHKFIHYNFEATNVKPLFSPSPPPPGSNECQWEVTVRDVLSGKEARKLYDVIMICTG